MLETHTDQLPGPTRKLSPATSYLARLAPGSRDTMARALRMISESLGYPDPREVPWGKVGYAETQAIAAAIREQYAPRTVNRILSALRGVLEEAWNLGLMDGDDYQRARRVKSSHVDTLPAGRQLSGGEISALVESCRDGTRRGSRDLGLLALMLGAGLRRQEAVNLRVSDLQDGSLRVVGKRKKERRAMFLHGALPMLEEWLDTRGRSPGPILYAVNKADRVLTRPVSLSGVNSVLAERGRVAGVGRFSPHDLRRTFASRLLSGGADLLAVQGLMGHSSPVVTEIYDRRGDDKLREATAKVSILDPTNVDDTP